MIRAVGIVAALGFALVPSTAWAQANPGPQSGPLGSGQYPSNNPGSGSGDMPGTATGLSVRAVAGQLKGAYGLDLSRRIASAQTLVDQVNRGRMLTAGDAGHIRSLMREDFIAWSKRYDLPLPFYRAERDRWLVDVQALTPRDWASQRLKWLYAQREWVLAHGG